MAKYGNHGIYRILIPCPIPPFDDNDSAVVVVISDLSPLPLLQFMTGYKFLSLSMRSGWARRRLAQTGVVKLNNVRTYLRDRETLVDNSKLEL